MKNKILILTGELFLIIIIFLIFPYKTFALSQGVGAGFSRIGDDGRSWGIVISNTEEVHNKGEIINAAFVVYQCRSKRIDFDDNSPYNHCDGDSPDFVAGSREDVSMPGISLPGKDDGDISLGQKSFSKGFSCGRIQVDLAAPGFDQVLGGTQMAFENDCVAPTPTPTLTPTLTPTPSPSCSISVDTCSGSTVRLKANWNLSGNACSVFAQGGTATHTISNSCNGSWSDSKFPNGVNVVPNGGIYQLVAKTTNGTQQCTSQVTTNCSATLTPTGRPTATPTQSTLTPTATPVSTLTPTPIQGTPTPTPRDFNEALCTCDGITTSGIVPGGKVSIETFAKVKGEDVQLAKVTSMTYNFGVAQSKNPNLVKPLITPVQISAVITENTSEKVRYKTNFQFVVPTPLPNNPIYRVWTNIKCTKKTAQLTDPSQVVLGESTQKNTDLLSNIKGVFLSISTTVQTKIQDVLAAAIAPKSSLQLAPIYPAQVEGDYCSSFWFQFKNP